jgi:hypothetical protein
MTLAKMSEKNTKKQILMEHEKALQIIAGLQNTTVRGAKIPVQANNTLSIEKSIKAFNTFSDKVKDDMSQENTVIQMLKEQIEEKKETIKDLYESTPEVTIETLIKSHKAMLEAQESNFVLAKDNSQKEIQALHKIHDASKEAYTLSYKERKDAFSLSSSRSKKEDQYNKDKSLALLEKEVEAILLDNETQKEDLKEHYQTKWKEVTQKLEENQTKQNDMITKAKALKEKLEKEVESKVSSIVGRQKANNTYSLRDIEQEYSNKITLKQTQLENFKVEESRLDSQITQIQAELLTVQEKAHILATKTYPWKIKLNVAIVL